VRQRIAALHLPIYAPGSSVFYYDVFFALTAAVILEKEKTVKRAVGERELVSAVLSSSLFLFFESHKKSMWWLTHNFALSQPEHTHKIHSFLLFMYIWIAFYKNKKTIYI
jgi:hypothetical protein